MTLHKAKPGRTPEFSIRRLAGSRMPARCLRKVTCLWLVSLLFAVLALPARGAEKSKNQVDLLIARNQVQDPYFRHSVVLLLPNVEAPLVVGLIINKPTRFTIAQIIPDSPDFKGVKDLAYFGGPVEIRIPSVVFRSSTAPNNAVKLFDSVYLTFDADVISNAFSGEQPGRKARMFLGRAQWGPNQLQNEIRQGGWYRIQAEGNLVFSTHPDDLWRTLHDRSAPSKYIRYRLPSGNPQSSAREDASM
jgi:putative transcriptional regulator